MTSRSESPGVDEVARAFLAEAAGRVDQELNRLLPSVEAVPERLHEAMRYSVLAPGKRLRPALALATCRAFGGDEEACLAPASALEMIHAYSLIHDDLPAMDDDDMRRGQPTSHRVFGEALAILAGDALHTLAAEVLATHPEGEDRAALRSRLGRLVFGAAGWRGMVGGQVLDMAWTGSGGATTEEQVKAIHARKTGALLRASVVLGAEVAGVDESGARAADELGAVLGLAFQVVDDVLDVTSSADVLGKTGGKDEAAGKATYPAVLGLTGARRRAEELTAEALDLLRRTSFPAAGDPVPLIGLTRFILERTS